MIYDSIKIQRHMISNDWLFSSYRPTFHFDVVVGDHDRNGNDGFKVSHEIDTYHCHQRYGKDMW